MLAWMTRETLEAHPGHQRSHLLVALAPESLAQGRNQRPYPAAGGGPGGLRRRRAAAQGGPVGSRLPHRRAKLLLPPTGMNRKARPIRYSGIAALRRPWSIGRSVARIPASDALTPEIHDRGDHRDGGGGTLFRPPGADAIGAGGGDVVRHRARWCEMLRHLRLGHVPAVLLSLALALVILSAVGTFVGAQFAGLASNCPATRPISATRFSPSAAQTGDGTLARLNQHHRNSRPSRSPAAATSRTSTVAGGAAPKKRRCRW